MGYLVQLGAIRDTESVTHVTVLIANSIYSSYAEAGEELRIASGGPAMSRSLRKLGFLVMFLVVVFPGVAVSASHYIRQGAAGQGDGSDWVNAWQDLPTAFVRGDMYYVADGTYGAHTFGTPTNGTSYIFVRKATASDHGTEVGWNPSYGDGQATFSVGTGDVWIVTSSYWDFNGQTGSGESGHGFKLASTDTTTANKLFRVSGSRSYVSIAHTEFACPGEDHEGLNQDGYYAADPGTSNLIISYCYFHDVTRNFITISSVSDVMIEYCVFTRRHTTNNNPHGQGIQIGPGQSRRIIVRYSVHYDQYSTAFICPLDNTHDYIEVYGNIFYQNNTSRYLTSNGILANTTGDSGNHWRFYNNTIADCGTSGRACGLLSNSGTDNLAYNNVWYNSRPTVFTNFSHNYNWFYGSGTQTEEHIQNGTGSPFMNAAARDFRLRGSTGPGISLPSPYDRGPSNELRGSDGLWDRGVFEFQASTIRAPGNLRIVQIP